ncbi:MAG: response regulator [Chloroflexi bacterium]|nr:response regulator [Chloroflexota bacterium]
MTINALIIDDNDVSIEVLQQALRSIGAEFTSLSRPENLNAIMERLPDFDIIFVDIVMPRVDGYEVLRQLKAQVKQDVPIVAHTVHINELDIARAEGFDSFLAKPIEMDHFKDQVERILAGEQLWEIL